MKNILVLLLLLVSGLSFAQKNNYNELKDKKKSIEPACVTCTCAKFPKSDKKCKKEKNSRKCLEKMLSKFVIKHFDHQVFAKNNVKRECKRTEFIFDSEGNTTGQTKCVAYSPIIVFVNFRVNKEGFVDNVRSSCKRYPILETEAKRIFAKMPQLQPATKDGVPYEMCYNMPISL